MTTTPSGSCASSTDSTLNRIAGGRSRSTWEHYREAERLLALADRDVSDNWPVTCGESKADVLAAAQVHATLATVQDAPPREFVMSDHASEVRS